MVSGSGVEVDPSRPGPIATTLDDFLDGRLRIEQPRRGAHRAGLDAILLASAVPSGATGHLVDLGAGVGTAGLAAALRSPDLDVSLVERDPVMADLARANADRLTRGGHRGAIRVVVTDVTGRARDRETAGLARESADQVILNPPFFAPRSVRASPHAGKSAAHVLPDGTLDAWIRTAADVARPGGRVALIFRGDAIETILAALKGRFGGVAIVPIHPRQGEPAHRLVVTAVKGRRAAPAVMPGLVLHPAGSNSYLEGADAILRGRCSLLAAVGETEQRISGYASVDTDSAP